MKITISEVCAVWVLTFGLQVRTEYQVKLPYILLL